MVRTDDDLDNLAPEEKLKLLQRLRKQKKDELEELLATKKREITDAEKRVLEQEEEIQKEIEEEKARQEEESQKQLEQLLEDAPETKKPAQGLENIPASIYQFTDYNVYHELTNIEKSIGERGYATRSEQEKIRTMQQTSDALKNAYTPQEITRANESRGNYLERTEDVLARLDKKLHDIHHGTIYQQ